MKEDKISIDSYSDVAWCNSKHTLLGMNIHLSDGSVLPYAYCVSGEEDNDGYICKAVKQHYTDGLFTDIAECPQWRINLESESLASDVRENRNQLLNDTDKYMTFDYPISDENRDRIRKYRQELRDLTNQDGFPENVIWPEKPDFV